MSEKVSLHTLEKILYQSGEGWLRLLASKATNINKLLGIWLKRNVFAGFILMIGYIEASMPVMNNPVLNLVTFCRWVLRDKAMQRRSTLR